MKKVFLLMVVCCFFAAEGFGQEAAKDENPNAPEITFTETTHDFGTIPLKGLAECEFIFTNTGKEPLFIHQCSASCGCTVPTCPQDIPIKPGEKGSIKVKYTTTQVPGPFSKPFTVVSNAKNARITLIIKGEISNNPEIAATK